MLILNIMIRLLRRFCFKRFSYDSDVDDYDLLLMSKLKETRDDIIPSLCITDSHLPSLRREGSTSVIFSLEAEVHVISVISPVTP